MNRHSSRHRHLRWNRWARLGAVALIGGQVFGSNCMESDIAKRFRDAYVPGLVSGLSTAVSAPGQAEDGLREAWAALIAGLGAALENRTPPTGSSSSGSSSSGGSGA